MGIRETLNQNPAITTGVTAGIIVLALAIIIYQLIPSRPVMFTKAYYTIDDGATWFEDEATRIPPFEHNGQQAVRAYLFTCDGGRTKFIGYLERYTPEAKRRIEQMQARAETEEFGIDPMMFSDLEFTGVEVKKPGDERWFRRTDERAMMRVMDVRCPDGTTENLQPVLPR